SLSVSIFDRLDQIGFDLVVRQLIDSTSGATNRNKVTRFARIDPESDIMRQSFAVGNLHEARDRDGALRRPDAAARRPYLSSLSSFFHRSQASSRAFRSASRICGLFGSPIRMKPWPAPL